MIDAIPGLMSRRELLKTTGKAAAASAVAGLVLPQHVYAAGDDMIQMALVGCGGRGTGAADNALQTQQGPTKVVALADIFQEKVDGTYKALKDGHSGQVDVPEDRRFVGFDAYKKAMDCLNPGDVVILGTPPAFRWVQFKYAIEKGLNVFMEKPVSVDGPTSRKMFALADEADKKGIKVAVGLMCRHCDARGELYDRINHDKQIGDLVLMRAYRVAGPTAGEFIGKKPDGVNELEWQIRNFHAFLWASGGAFSDYLIHNIDECCWMKDAWPVKAVGFGGRNYRLDNIDQNFDVYSTEYTFGDGSKFIMEGRCMPGCYQEFASFAHGTKGSAVISQAGHAPSRARIYTDQKMQGKENLAWAFPQPEPNPYQLEWEDFMKAIRNGESYNEAHRGTEASLITAMGRFACHTGQEVTRDGMLACEQEFAPNADQLTLGGPAPLQADSNGKYPVPLPGFTKKREY